MSVEATQELVEKLQRDIAAYDDQIRQAQDRNQPDQIPDLQAKQQELGRQLSSLQTKMADEQKKEAEQKAEEARKEQEKKDNSGIGGFLG